MDDVDCQELSDFFEEEITKDSSETRRKNMANQIAKCLEEKITSEMETSNTLLDPLASQNTAPRIGAKSPE